MNELDMSKDKEDLDQANAIIHRLVMWAEQTGGWDAVCWRDAERYLAVEDIKQTHNDVCSMSSTDMKASTYLIVAKSKDLLDKVADDGNEDRDYVVATTVEEAIGKFMIANPRVSYSDILDHMEV